MSMCRPRVLLSDKEAQEIFKLQTNHGYPSLHSASVVFAKRYGVSPKAIRDIWSGRSWLEATFSLWNAEQRPERRTIGRPKGSKDSKPRKCKKKSQHILGGVHHLHSSTLGDKQIFRSGDPESVSQFPPFLARSTLEDCLHGLACNQNAMPSGLLASSIFRSIQGFGGPTTPYFNPTAGLSPPIQPMNAIFSPSYLPTCLRLPPNPFLFTETATRLEDGWGIDATLARRCFDIQLQQSALQMILSADPLHNVSAGGFGVFRPS